MCDILRRLASPALTKQQYLSSLNEFSRMCRARKKEELFQVFGSVNETTKLIHHNNRISSPNHSLTLFLDTLAIDASQTNNPVFKLNRADENDIFTMDDVFRW